MGPHAGHEADLLLMGKKPIGLICAISAPLSDQSPECLQDLADIARLDQAVSQGRLSKLVVPVLPLEAWDGADGAAHFYCQKGREDDASQVAAFHQAIWSGREEDAFLPYDVALFFGYAQKDVERYMAGGNQHLPMLQGLLLRHTHALRKKCRLAGLTLEDPS